jgi:hypothetical protein
MIAADYFSRYEPGIFAPLHDVLLAGGDHYMRLADLPILYGGRSQADGVVCR